MYGLEARYMTAGLDEIRETRSNQVCALERIGGSGFARLGISSRGFITCFVHLAPAGGFAEQPFLVIAWLRYWPC